MVSEIFAVSPLKRLKITAAVQLMLLGSGLLLAQAPSAVTTDMACMHLLIAVADGPHAAPWHARANMLKESGLSASEVQAVMAAANTYAAALAPLSKKAAAIHQGLKSKTLLQSQGVSELTGLDQQRRAIFANSYSDLRLSLGQSWDKFEAFLDQDIKPNVVTR